MEKILDLLLREPVRVAAISVVVTGVALVEAFGVHLDDGQKVAAGAFALAVLALFEVVRNGTTPYRGDE